MCRRRLGPGQRLSADGVATGGVSSMRDCMPTAFQGHRLMQDRSKNRKYLISGTPTEWMRECGRAICGSSAGATCWAWHLESICRARLRTCLSNGQGGNGRGQWSDTSIYWCWGMGSSTFMYNLAPGGARQCLGRWCVNLSFSRSGRT